MSVATVIVYDIWWSIQKNGINLVGYFVQDDCFVLALSDFRFTLWKYIKRAPEVKKNLWNVMSVTLELPTTENCIKEYKVSRNCTKKPERMHCLVCIMDRPRMTSTACVMNDTPRRWRSLQKQQKHILITTNLSCSTIPQSDSIFPSEWREMGKRILRNRMGVEIIWVQTATNDYWLAASAA